VLLKRVAMSGFKSFADRVEFDFAPGVTCIVGPNGCGKSNVVDSFKWVLGEQSAKSLRGKQMLDMIFNGSSSRKSSGMAQVDLVFDNTDRMLPIDRDEVTITRKLYRSGESEYLVCKEPSRLKDIRELFLDTGIGSNAYAIIEQGKVESLLHASAQDRRAIFEEAAGISKYRARKREAERKLERTQQNLLRAADIIEEVERRLRSVKLQAGKARNFQQYDARLRELRASFSMAEFHRLSETLAALGLEIQSAEARVVETRAGIEQREAEAGTVQADLDRLGESIAATENRLAGVRSEVSANEERAAAAENRIAEQQGLRQRAEQRLSQAEAHLAEQQAQLEVVQQQAHALQEETHAQNQRIDELAAAEQDAVRRLTQTQALLDDEKAGLFDLLRRTAQLHNEITSLARHTDTLSGRKGRLFERDAIIAEELQEVVTRRGVLQSKLHEVESLIATETERLNEKKEAARLIDAERARLSEELAGEKERRSALVSRKQILHDLQKRMEGVGAGARRVLDRKLLHPEHAGLAAVRGLVAAVFEADVARARIVEAAIGEADQNLVVSDTTAFLADPSLLALLPERTTVIGLDRLPQPSAARDFSDRPGFVATALSFVRYAPDMAALAECLLGRVIIVDTLANALAIAAEEDAAGFRFVTLHGEVVEPDGRVRVGPPHSRAGLISRMSELRAIDEQWEGLEAHIAHLADELNRRAAQTQHLEQVQQELRTSIYELHTARVETNAALQNVEEAIRRLTAEQPLIAGEVAAIEQELREAQEKSSANQESLTQLQQISAQREAQVARIQQQIEELGASRTALAEELTQARVAAGQLMEKRAAAAETINALRRGMRAAEEAVASAQQEIAGCDGRIADSQAAIAACNARLEELRAEAGRLEETVQRLRQEREDKRHRAEALQSEIRQLRMDLEEVEHHLHEQQMEAQKAELRRTELCARVRDELHIELQELYAQYEHTEQDWAAVENEIAELKQKIERLGNINLDAIQEQEELEERAAFLTGQRDDLESSRKQLDALIAQLNGECQKRFTEAFFAIRDNFRDLFRKLFGGGKADIILENPDDVLESGIEILARPPGKELQSISLLSGGEKSMTAIALLMSIFRSRPSPFAILDEVDAALDEANNARFNNIIREFLDRSQFIVITHSKRTMSIADQMYGVTMQEPGVSTRVSVKFEKIDEAATAVA
jgi:chromosome segregation protein